MVVESLEALLPLSGEAVVEFVSVPSNVLEGELVDITVRYKMTGSRGGPFLVENLSIREDDPAGVYQTIAKTDGQRFSVQDTWNEFTFENVRLSDYEDGGNGVELYAYVNIDNQACCYSDEGDRAPDNANRYHRVSVTPGEPDLRVKSLSVSATTVSRGESIEIDAVVRNYGNSDAGRSKVGYYFGSTPGSRDTYIGEGVVPNFGVLSPDEEEADSPTAFPQSNFTIDVQPGTYYITAIADYESDVDESDEDNNSRSQEIFVAQPDLRVKSLTVSDTTVAVGDEIEIDAVVGNYGVSNAEQTVVRYYFGPSRTSRQTEIGEGIVPNFGVLSPDEEASDSPTAWPQSNFEIPNVAPGTYYINAIADVDDDVDESDENNNVLSREIIVGNIPTTPISRLICGTTAGPGVTIITHGFQALGNADSRTPAWTLEMAEAILDRADGPSTDRSTGTILVHDPNSSSWVAPVERGINVNWTNSNSPNDEIVLVYDWTWDSDDPQEGWSEAAADSLFASLAETFDVFPGESIDLLNRSIHFIGHSRGTVVNTFAVNRIGHYFPHVTIDQFTTLDPHPSTIHNDPGSGSFPQVLEIPENILWADNYYRKDSDTIPASYELDGDFDGVPVQGARNLQLNESVLVGGYLTEHSDVHLWYLATIKDSSDVTEVEGKPLPNARWWESGVAFSDDIEPNSGRSNVGFARSRIGGLPRPAEQIDRDKLRVPQVPASVFNGDFELGVPFTERIPGWERHGGGGTGNLDEKSENQYLQLNRNDESRQHNKMYFPTSATELKFDYWIHDHDGGFTQDDELEVWFGSELIDAIRLIDRTDGFQTHRVTLGAEQVGTYRDLELRINGNGRIDSGVRIDNVRLLGDRHTPNIDMNTIHSAIVGNSDDATFDLNKDGRVDTSDGSHFVDACNTFAGDANLDGRFDSTDLIRVFQIGVYEEESRATWSAGDWNFDGVFDSGDLIAAFSTGKYERTAVAALPAEAVSRPVEVVLNGRSRDTFFEDRYRRVDAAFEDEGDDDWRHGFLAGESLRDSQSLGALR